jgi:hypothetical protein
MSDETPSVEPPSIHPSMIHLNLSKIVPTKTYDYLSALLPGLFFEISIVMANPCLIDNATAKLPGQIKSISTLSVVIALFLAFVIGNAFMYGVNLIPRFLARCYVLADFLSSKIYDRCSPLHTVQIRVKHPKLAPFLNRLDRYAMQLTTNRDRDFAIVTGCLNTLTRGFVERKYGIKPNDFQLEHWQVLYPTLAKPTREEVNGSLMTIATHATGWCGLAAIRFAPALRNTNYLTLCVLMIAAGLYYDLSLARTWSSPINTRVMNIRGMLREFNATLRGS